MPKVTWLGEDTEEISGPSYNIWNGVKFPKGKPVEITDPYMLGKARGSRFYKVTEDEFDEGELVNIQGSIGCNTDIQPPRKQQETQHAQTKAQGLADIAKELKSKIENKKEDHDFRKTEKGSGYTPGKKKVGKAKAASRAGVSAPHARPDSTDTDAA